VLTHLMHNVNCVQYFVTQNLMQNIANKQKHTHAHFKSNLSNMTTKYGQRTLLSAFLIISFVY
jgi:ABC-type nickel/cobalt efflux system permease component RcnA